VRIRTRGCAIHPDAGAGAPCTAGERLPGRAAVAARAPGSREEGGGNHGGGNHGGGGGNDTRGDDGGDAHSLAGGGGGTSGLRGLGEHILIGGGGGGREADVGRGGGGGGGCMSPGEVDAWLARRPGLEDVRAWANALLRAEEAPVGDGEAARLLARRDREAAAARRELPALAGALAAVAGALAVVAGGGGGGGRQGSQAEGGARDGQGSERGVAREFGREEEEMDGVLGEWAKEVGVEWKTPT
jgi:hypothetical protein